VLANRSRGSVEAKENPSPPRTRRNILNLHVPQRSQPKALGISYRRSRQGALPQTSIRGAARLEVLTFTAKAALHYGQIRSRLERAGKKIGSLDTLIGGHARSEGLILVTNNLREFERIDGLRVENWSDRKRRYLFPNSASFLTNSS
jgi:hypothetical protein